MKYLIALSFMLLVSCYAETARRSGDGSADPRVDDPVVTDGTFDPGLDDTYLCPPGQLNCGGICVDIMSNPMNCGACGVVCGVGGVCMNGICTGTSCACAPGTTCCGDVCVDTLSDWANCGECGNVCPPGTICMGGMCTCTCPPGLECCDSGCTDLASDPMNCGGCGRMCPEGVPCVDETCGPTDPCSGVVCPGRETCCYGMCVNLMFDPNNCGDCGAVCPWGSSDPDPDTNRLGCLDPSMGVYNLCCGGYCAPVSDRRCGDCRTRCDPSMPCTGLWDEAALTCTFACMGI